VKVVYATATTVVTMPGGWPLGVHLGTHWRADDPLVVDHPDLFTEDPKYGMSYSAPPPPEPRIEQTTAAPGERRNVTIPNQADASFAELERLRAEAEAAGIKVDGRWSIQRLREALAAARA
jgi:hypothetical protein